LSVPLYLSDGQILNVKIKTCTRSKNIRLKADIYGIHVVAPTNYEIEGIINFIQSKRNWIFKASKYFRRFVDNYGQGNDIRENLIPFLGTMYRLQIVKDKVAYTIIWDELKLITFHLKDRRKYKDDLRKWYKSQISKIIYDRLPLISNRLGLQYDRVCIKNQKSRWASCSKGKNLNFNFLMAVLPSELIDYIIIHELMHIKELNHSERFWKLVSTQSLLQTT
jgi:predicted metal-dependent hydrolase